MGLHWYVHLWKCGNNRKNSNTVQCIYIYMYLHMYIIHIIYLCTSIYNQHTVIRIYMYIYIYRERERCRYRYNMHTAHLWHLLNIDIGLQPSLVFLTPKTWVAECFWVSEAWNHPTIPWIFFESLLVPPSNVCILYNILYNALYNIL